MTLVVVGLNHRTAPVEIREKLALSGGALQTALEDLRDFAATHDPTTEAAILSTCNRFEVYLLAQHPEDGAALVEQFLCERESADCVTLNAHLYRHIGDDAAQHLMRIACGLESMILGESQILGQVAQAFEAAHSAGTTGPILSHLFAQALHTGKRARTETPISRHTTSVSHAGALLLSETLHAPQTARIMVIGAGEMAVLAAQALTRFNMRDLTFINRTHPRAEALAADFGGKALPWERIEEALAQADAVICATGAAHPILYRRNLEGVVPRQDGQPLVILDIAVPRDVDAGVRELPGVRYYAIDALQSVVDTHIERRRAAIPQVETIIQEEMARFVEWQRSRQVTPVIRTLREWAESITEAEVEQTLNRLPDADERTQQLVQRLAHRLVNRLLHEPTACLRMQANAGNAHGYAHAVRALFGLDDGDGIVCQAASSNCIPTTEDDDTALCDLHCIMPYATSGEPL